MTRPLLTKLARAARAALIGVILVGAAAAVAIAAAELAVRATYAFAFWRTESWPLVYERVYWAVPPWVQQTSVLYEDAELGLWTRPDTTRTYVNLFGPIGDLAEVGELFDALFPTLPEWARRRPVWTLTTNSLGLRAAELAARKPPGALRIVALGDSWTVGVNVAREETWVARLADLLGEAMAPRPVEVVNFGVVGGKAETGRRLLPRVLALEPDIVVVAYAQNDEIDTRTARPSPPRSGPAAVPRRWRWRSVLERFELYRLYRWWRTPGEDRIAAALRRELSRPTAVPVNAPGRPCPNPLFAESSYAWTLDEIVAAVTDAGVRTVLLYNSVPDFSSHCTWHAMSRVAARRGVAVVDSSTILEDLGERLDAEREVRLGLVPDRTRRTAPREVANVLLRVDMSAHDDARPPFVLGNHAALGAFVPNAVALFDDGSHGDQRAGDAVWSRLVAVSTPQVLTYAFSNGAPPGTWTGLENYRLRAFAVRQEDFGRTAYPPVARFGAHVLRSDPSHPDAAGHEAIARALLEPVRALAGH